jgi:hypothetical protein
MIAVSIQNVPILCVKKQGGLRVVVDLDSPDPIVQKAAESVVRKTSMLASVLQ